MPANTIQQNKANYYKKAFDAVIDHYHTLRSASVSGLRGLDYSKSGGGTNTANIVRVSPSDFICDVELASRKALEQFPALFQVFKQCYMDCTVEPNTESPTIDVIRARVGRIYCERKLFPATIYFKPVVIDRGRGKTPRPSVTVIRTSTTHVSYSNPTKAAA